MLNYDVTRHMSIYLLFENIAMLPLFAQKCEVCFPKFVLYPCHFWDLMYTYISVYGALSLFGCLFFMLIFYIQI